MEGEGLLWFVSESPVPFLTISTIERELISILEVTFICVTPMSQRQGVGRQLMQVAFDKARKEGLPLIVCSEPAAHNFFEVLGFKETKYAEIDLAKLAPKHSGFGVFRLTGMIWES